MSSFSSSNSFRRSLLAMAEQEKQTWCPGQVAPISPTPHDLIRSVLSECALDSSTTMVDLGCGDGRWLESVARLCGCRCWGVDIDTERCAHLKVDEEFRGLHIEIIKSDFSTLSLRNFSFVVVYLGRSGNSVVKDKLTTECTKGTTVVSVGFQIVGWNPNKQFSSSSGIAAYKYVL